VASSKKGDDPNSDDASDSTAPALSSGPITPAGGIGAKVCFDSSSNTTSTMPTGQAHAVVSSATNTDPDASTGTERIGKHDAVEEGGDGTTYGTEVTKNVIFNIPKELMLESTVVSPLGSPALSYNNKKCFDMPPMSPFFGASNPKPPLVLSSSRGKPALPHLSTLGSPVGMDPFDEWSFCSEDDFEENEKRIVDR